MTPIEFQNVATQTSEEDGTSEKPNKYIAVVYHQVSGSYQNGASPQYAVDLVESSKTIIIEKSEEMRQLAEIPDYLILSIIALIIFIPFGLVAIDKTFEVRRARESENLKAAREASSWALQYALIAFLAGPMFTALMLLTVFLTMY